MSSVSSSTSASSLESNYLNLLITQMQNQDPMDPMDNSAMTAALTGLSELQQMQDMSTSFQQVLTSQQTTEATTMIGATVTYTPSGSTTSQQALVDGVSLANGEVQLTSGQNLIPLSDVQSIQYSDSATSY